MKRQPVKPAKRKPFKRLTPAQKRVAIAKDVLKQIAAHRVEVQDGVFVASRLDKRGALNYNQASVQKLKTCTACAVGCAILSGIRLFNEVDRVLINRPDEMYRWFLPKQVRMIEQAFEGVRWYSGSNNAAAIDFGKRYPLNHKRAIAIFKNIIANKGQFIP